MCCDYFQFYVEDGGTEPDTGSADYCTEDINNRMAIATGNTGISTASYDNVSVSVEIHDEPPELSLARWDHIAITEQYSPSRFARLSHELRPLSVTLHASPCRT